jgi:hypothetical protein
MLAMLALSVSPNLEFKYTFRVNNLQNFTSTEVFLTEFSKPTGNFAPKIPDSGSRRKG